MPESVAIEVHGLKKTYRDGRLRRRSFEALKGVSFDVHRGEIFGLLGPNGAGKTTFIKILLGLVRKSGGDATLLGFPAGDRHGRKLVGYLPENLRVPRHLTAVTAMEYYGRLSGVSWAEIHSRREELLQLVGLADRAKDSVRKYSKGMLQRLGLAQALLHRPDLLVLDEPTDGLDPVARSQVREMLSQIKKQGTTIFLNSHILQEVELVCDRVAILDQGNLRHVGSVSDIVSNQRAGKTQSGFEVDLAVAGAEATVRSALGAAQPRKWNSVGNDQYQFNVHLADQAAVDALVDSLRRQNVSILSLSRQRISLEDAFLEILAEPVEIEVVG